jgi:hypothetical protein
MTDKEYNKLLKFLYFEGYAETYADAETLIEEVNDEDFDTLYEEFLITEATESVVEYLVSEGFSEDKESASAIVNVMSDEWLDQILEVKMTTISPEKFEKIKHKLHTNPNRMMSRADKAALQRMTTARQEQEAQNGKTKPGRVTLGDKPKPEGERKVRHSYEER